MIYKKRLLLFALAILFCFSLSFHAYAGKNYFAVMHSEEDFDQIRQIILKNKGNISHRLDSKSIICSCSESNLEHLKINSLIDFYSSKKIESKDEFKEIEDSIRIWNLLLEENMATPSAVSLKDMEEKAILNQITPVFSDSTEGKPYQAYDTQTSSYALGKICVTVVFPESNGSVDLSKEDWTQSSIDNVKAKVVSAMDKLSVYNPDARLTFVYDYPANPGTSALASTTDCNYEAISRASFDTALVNNVMNNLGFSGSSGTDLLREFVHARREFNESDWGFVFLVTNNLYTGGGRASAMINGPAANIFADTSDSIILHETCHLFGALDEYHPDAFQSPVAMAGYLHIVNANSQYNDGNGYNAGAGEGHPGIMLNNSSYFSPYTTGAIGWIDYDTDGIPDIIDTFPAVTINSLTGDSTLTCSGSAAVTPNLAIERNSNSINTISDIEYRVNNGIWLKANASDGEFSSSTENFDFITAQLPAGDYLIEVRAKNSAGNWSRKYAYRLYTVSTSSLTVRNPSATIQLSPETGSIATPFLFKALCSDFEDNNKEIQVRWDWNNDNVWDTPFDTRKFKQNTFQTAGIHTVKCQVKNTSGSTYSVSRDITVTSGDNSPVADFYVKGTYDSFSGISHTFTFEANTSYDPEDNKSIQYKWDWESDGIWDTDFSSNTTISHEYKLYNYSFSLSSMDAAYSNIPGRGTVISGDSFFIASGSYGINVFIISDPENPVFVKTISNSNAFDVQVKNDYLYCSSENSGFTVYNINPVSSATAVKSFTDYYVSDLEINSNYLFTACGSSGIKIYNISTPELPVLTNTISITESNYTIKTSGSLLFVLTASGALKVYDYTDIQNIQLKSSLTVQGTGYPINMAVKDSLLFAALSSSDVQIFDFSNPLALMLKASIPDISTQCLEIADNTLIAQGSTGDLKAVNFEDPVNPYVSGFFNHETIISGVYKDEYLFFTTGNNNFGVIKTSPDTSSISKQWKVTLQVKDSSGLTSNCSRFIWANPYNSRPTATFTVNPASGSPATNFLFNAAASSDADFANNWDNMKLYRWDFDGDGNFDTPFSESNSSIYHNYALSGVYTAVCQVRDRFRAISESAKQVIVSIDGTGTPPQAVMTVSTASASLNQAINFSALLSSDPDTGTGGLSYLWDFDNDGIWDTVAGTTAETTWSYEIAGTYQARLRVTDSTGLFHEVTSEITVSKAVNGPYSEITFPENGAVLSAPTVISGTASDNTGTVSLVEIRIMRDGPFYLRSDGIWTSSETWFEPSGGTGAAWSHNISGVTFEKGISYLVKSRVTGSSGAVELPGSGITFIIGTEAGPQSSCSGQKTSATDKIKITVISENPSALISLWYKKSSDTSYTDSTLKLTGSGTLNFTFPEIGSYDFYTSSSYNGAIEPAPSEPDFTSTYRTDLPIAKNIKLIYEQTGYWFQINEIEIYGTDSSEESAKLQIASVTTSTEGYAGYDKSKIIDGLKNFNNDFAVSNPTLPLSITIHLAEPAFISSIYHYNDGQYGASEVKVETDGLSNMTEWNTFGLFAGLDLTENRVNLDYLSLTSKILINEVYLGSSGFIELYNAGTTSVNINLWKLKLGTQEISLPDTSISGGAFYVILFGTGTSDASKYYVSEQFPWDYSDSGSVALLKSGGNGVDFVRWGINTDSPPAGTAFDGSNPSVPPLGKSLGRNLNSEDNDSGDDWTVQNPTKLQKNTDSGKYIITGTIKDENGQPVKSATVTVNGSLQAVSDSNGYYVLTDLEPGNYNIIPSSSTYSFNPASLQVTLGPDSNNADFQAAPLSNTYSISGWIRNQAQGISGVSVNLDNSKTVTTSSTGYYYFPSVSAGSYTITPSKTGYSFTPTSLNVSLVSTSLKEQNFDAIPGSSLYLIRGQIKTSEGSPLPDVTLTCNNVTVKSDASGYYIFSSFTSGEFVITPSKSGYNFSPAVINVSLGPDSESNNFTAIASTASNKRVRGQYFKIKYTSFNDVNWLQINEIQFFGSTDSSTSSKLSVSQIIPSKNPYPGFGVSKLIDSSVVSNGDFAVNISGTAQFELVFDMGQEVIVDKIIHQNDLVYGALKAELLVSDTSLTGPFDTIQTFSDLTINAQGAGQDILLFSSGKILINEVNLESDGFIEFYNVGTTDINMTGWTFTGGDKTYTFPLIFLKKGDFILLKNGSGVDNDKTKFLFDQFNWSPGVAGSAALKDETGKGIDFVRWGTSVIMPPSGTFWTGVNPPSPTAGQSLSRNFTFVDTDASSDFMSLTPSPGTANYQSFTVSGYIKNSTLQGVAGVSVEIENFGSVLTDSTGKFTADLKPGTYNLIPIREGYNFSPQIKSVNVVNSYINDCDFSAAGGANIFVLSGYIKDASGNPVGNVSIKTQNMDTATSSASTGFWAISSLSSGNFELIPSKEGIIFSPPVYQVTLGPSRANINFTVNQGTSDNYVYVDSEAFSQLENGSVSNPYHTISNAVFSSPEGSVIYVRSGEYHESFQLKSNHQIIGDGAFNTFVNGDGFEKVITLGPGSKIHKLSVYGGSTGIYSEGADAELKNIAVGNCENGLILTGAVLSLKNCVITNTSDNCVVINSGSYFSCNSSILTSITQNGGTVSNIDYTNIVNGGYGVSLGTGNISSNPYFNNSAARDYRLQSSSPCINSGSPDSDDYDDDSTRNDMGVFGGKNYGQIIEKILPIGVYTTYDAFPGYTKDKLSDNKKNYNGDFALKINSSDFSIIYDFGKDVSLEKVILFNDGAYGAKNVELLYASNSASNVFNRIALYENLILNDGVPNKNVFSFDTVKGRYFKFLIRDFNNSGWFQLNEIECYKKSEIEGNSQTNLYVQPFSAQSSINAFPGYDITKTYNDEIFFNNQFAVKNSGSQIVLTYDMGLDVNISNILHYNDGQYGANAVTVSYATQAESSLFIDIDTFSNLTVISDRPNEDTLSFSEVKGRYFKFVYNSFNNDEWFQLSEIKFSGVSESAEKISPVSIDSTPAAYAGFGTTKLFDNQKNYNSDYACRNSQTQTVLTIDLGQDRTFDMLKNYNDGYFGALKCNVDIALSASPDQFVNLLSNYDLVTADSQPALTDIRFSEQTARYIKITYTSFKDSVWFQLNEIEIFRQNSSAQSDYSIVSSEKFLSGQVQTIVNPLSIPSSQPSSHTRFSIDKRKTTKRFQNDSLASRPDQVPEILIGYLKLQENSMSLEILKQFFSKKFNLYFNKKPDSDHIFRFMELKTLNSVKIQENPFFHVICDSMVSKKSESQKYDFSYSSFIINNMKFISKNNKFVITPAKKEAILDSIDFMLKKYELTKSNLLSINFDFSKYSQLFKSLPLVKHSAYLMQIDYTVLENNLIFQLRNSKLVMEHENYKSILNCINLIDKIKNDYIINKDISYDLIDILLKTADTFDKKTLNKINLLLESAMKINILR